jgi:hypothetical protein
MNKTRISKRDFYARGGLSSPRLFRKMVSGSWSYWSAA